VHRQFGNPKCGAQCDNHHNRAEQNKGAWIQQIALHYRIDAASVRQWISAIMRLVTATSSAKEVVGFLPNTSCMLGAKLDFAKAAATVSPFVGISGRDG